MWLLGLQRLPYMRLADGSAARYDEQNIYTQISLFVVKYKKIFNEWGNGMIGKLELKLRCQEELAYPMASLFHGALMELLSEVSKSVAAINFPKLPVKSSENQKYFEYALNLDIKIRKREYADFIRAITP